MRVDLSKKYAEHAAKSKPPGGGLDFDAARRRLAEQKLRQAEASSKVATTGAFPTQAPAEVSQRFASKLAALTGGNKIAQGFGQMLAMGSTKKNLDEIQQGEGEMQQKLIQAIRANKAIGKDTSRLEASLKALTGGIADTGASAEGLYNPNKITGKQLAGDVIQLGTTIGTLGSLPGAAKNVVQPGIIKGAIAGAKTGAKLGTVTGGLTGLSQGLKSDKSIGDSLMQAGGGAVGGLVTGGVLGGVLGGVSGGITSRINKAKVGKEDFITDLVSPKATDKVKIQALKEGRVTEQGLLKASKILPSKRDVQLADAVKGVVSPKLSPNQNLNAIDAKVSDINSGVKAYVTVNKTPFNTNQLKSQLNKGKDELNLIFASDAQAEKTYDAVVREFVKHVGKKDTAGLFEARQKFDQIPAIKKLLDSQGLGENTKKEVVLTVRGMANKYVASLLPKGNEFRDTLLRESKMIEAMTNIAEKNSNTIGVNKLQLLDKKYPILRWIVGSAVGAGGVGVGGTIIRSSD